MNFPSYTPPLILRDGLAITLYAALKCSKTWEKKTQEPEPIYREVIFKGAGGVPIFGVGRYS